jgi:soluble lytic murein transglycosylase-like protein
MRALCLLLCLAGYAGAAEYAVLSSGARLRVDRHEASGNRIRLYAGEGITELDAGQVCRFDPEDHVPPAAAPAAAVIPAVPAPSPVGAHAMVDQVARKYSLPPEFLHSVVRAESGYRPDAVSPKGARGLMQLMPATAAAYGADAANPLQNLDTGARYLSELLLKYHGGVWHALAAYNAGPGAVEKHGGIPPYRETREYILRIMRYWREVR